MSQSGLLVHLPDGTGIGNFVGSEDGRKQLSIFHSITHRETRWFDIANLSRAFLSPQTRVYVEQPDSFRIGRVTDYFCERWRIDHLHSAVSERQVRRGARKRPPRPAVAGAE